MVALLAAAQEPPADSADTPEVTVTDTAPLAHPFSEPAELPPAILPVRRFRMDASGNIIPDRPARPRSSFWAEAAIGGAYTRTCDPFGRLGTECTSGNGPAATVSTGSAHLRLEAAGEFLGGVAKGHSVRASLRGRFTAIGPVRIGIALEGADLAWSRDVFTGGSTTLGTTRSVQAAFAGLDIGWGDYHRAHARLVVLPGYWNSAYHGTLDVPGFSGRQALALDEFGRVRIRMDAANIPLGSRVTVAGNMQRTQPYFTASRPTASPAMPRIEWSGGIRATARIWHTGRFGLRLFSEVRLPDTTQSMLDQRAVSIGAAVRFR